LWELSGQLSSFCMSVILPPSPSPPRYQLHVEGGSC
jgi:hypothetical protein